MGVHTRKTHHMTLYLQSNTNTSPCLHAISQTYTLGFSSIKLGEPQYCLNTPTHDHRHTCRYAHNWSCEPKPQICPCPLSSAFLTIRLILQGRSKAINMTLNLKENSRLEGQESTWDSYLMGSKNKNKTPLYKRTSCTLETLKSSNKSSEMRE